MFFLNVRIITMTLWICVIFVDENEFIMIWRLCLRIPALGQGLRCSWGRLSQRMICFLFDSLSFCFRLFFGVCAFRFCCVFFLGLGLPSVLFCTKSKRIKKKKLLCFTKQKSSEVCSFALLWHSFFCMWYFYWQFPYLRDFFQF